MAIASINPATGETLRVFEPLSSEALEQKLAHAFAAFQSYRKTSFAERARWLSNAAGILEDSKQEYGRIMTAEMGKTLQSAIAEAGKCAWACRYYAENGERHLADEAIATNASRSFVRYQPIGPVLAVMPWNFPFWQVFRFAAPALMAGNVGLLKHSSNVPQSRRGFLVPGQSFGWFWNFQGSLRRYLCPHGSRRSNLGLSVRGSDDVGWKPVRQRVPITSTPCNLGGQRLVHLHQPYQRPILRVTGRGVVLHERT